jgi:hypothetical protein
LIGIGDLDYNYLLTFFITMEEIGMFLSCEGEACNGTSKGLIVRMAADGALLWFIYVVELSIL